MNQQILLRGLLVLGALSTLGFMLINLKPDRPHLASRRHARILLRTEPERAAWLKENILAEFSALHDIDLDVEALPSYEEVIAALKKEKDTPNGLLLTVIDDELSDDIRDAGLVMPISRIASSASLEKELAEYLPEVTQFCRDAQEQVWFWPRRGEMTIATYLQPAVEDAYLNWTKDLPAIRAALIEANGVGLPANYQLEKSPDTWDNYDLFVAAWYWAHHPAPWSKPSEPDSPANGIAPRIAFRTGDNDDAIDDLVGAFYRNGFTEAALGKADAPSVLDALQWEALFRKHHLLAKECEDDKGLDEDQVAELFRKGRLAWAPIDQEDSLALHGGARRDAPKGIEMPQRLDWAVLPVGMSLELKDGKPARKGRSFSFQDFHLWAIPVHAPDPALALELIRFLTQTGVSKRETEAQGMLPMRKDLRDNYPILFRLDWMQSILDASYAQLALGSGQIPEAVAEKHYDAYYSKLRAAVLSTQPPPVDREAIRRIVNGVPHEQ